MELPNNSNINNLNLTEKIFFEQQKNNINNAIDREKQLYNIITSDSIHPCNNSLFKDIYEQQPSINSIPLKQLINSHKKHVKINVILRKYSESYMRPKRFPNERDCVNGKLCVIVTMNKIGKGWIGVEFFTIEQLAEIKRKNGNLPIKRGPCVICKRVRDNENVLSVVCNGKSVNDNFILVNSTEIFNVENEYLNEDKVPIPNDHYVGILFPIVLHQIHKYRYKENHLGEKYLTQEGYEYPNKNKNTNF